MQIDTSEQNSEELMQKKIYGDESIENFNKLQWNINKGNTFFLWHFRS